MFIREIRSHFRNLEISVELDPDLLNEFDCDDKNSTLRIISLNLYKLIYAIGTIQSRRFAPSNRQKFLDKADLIEKVYSNTSDLKIKINECRNSLGSEALKTISEDFGVGISVLIAINLFNIKYSTIQRIYGTDKRPDWSCQTVDNRILVVESKGATTKATSDSQLRNALIQKNKRVADVRVASLTLLNENQMSSNRFIDPPSSPDDMNSDLNNKVLRAGHYSSVFSFLGHSTLSKYFAQMRKRLLQLITPEEQNDKNLIYYEIRDKYSSINFLKRQYLGTFYQIDEKNYLYIGVDSSLISYEGFINFTDYENDIDENIKGNQYFLFRDGILIIEISNIKIFSEIVNIESIKNYQENNSLSDIDAMTKLSFEKYIVYLLRRIGFEVSVQDRSQNSVIDLVGIFENKRYVFELKLSRAKVIPKTDIDSLRVLKQDERNHKIILITNANLPQYHIESRENVILIGRNELKEIINHEVKLKELLTQLL